MRVPNWENAYISPLKLEGYLLAETHAEGRSKAKFFRALGFDETNVEQLAEGLKNILHVEDVVEVTSSPYGTKYVIDGILSTPSGNIVEVRTIWIIDMGSDRPRFVTSYPA